MGISWDWDSPDEFWWGVAVVSSCWKTSRATRVLDTGLEDPWKMLSPLPTWYYTICPLTLKGGIYGDWGMKHPDIPAVILWYHPGTDVHDHLMEWAESHELWGSVDLRSLHDCTAKKTNKHENLAHEDHYWTNPHVQKSCDLYSQKPTNMIKHENCQWTW